MGQSQSSGRVEGNTTPGMNMRSNSNRNRNRNRNRNGEAPVTTYMGGGKRSRKQSKARKTRRRTSKGRK